MYQARAFSLCVRPVFQTANFSSEADFPASERGQH